MPLRAVDLSARVEAFYRDEDDSEALSIWDEARAISETRPAAH